MELSSAQVMEAVKYCLSGRAGTAEYEPEIAKLVEEMLPALTNGEHLENTEVETVFLTRHLLSPKV